MSWITGLFKSKPGGTTVGNWIRGVAGRESNGALGNGTMMISQETADKRDLSDIEFYSKYGKTKNGVVTYSGTPAQVQQPQPIYQPTAIQTAQTGVLKNFVSTNISYIFLVVGGLVTLCYFAFKKKRFGR